MNTASSQNQIQSPNNNKKEQKEMIPKAFTTWNYTPYTAYLSSAF